MEYSLTHTAVVGTNHLSTHLSDTDLLQQLAVRAMQRLAGYVPYATDAELPVPAPHSGELICEQSTVVQFFRLHDSSKNHLKAIWIERFIKSGRKFPDEFLPELLSLVGENMRSRNGNTKYLTLMSKRVEWLAKTSGYGGWQWVLNSTSKVNTLLQDVERENPISWFTELRNINPRLGISWLSEHWNSIEDDLQTLYIDALYPKLCPIDEPFLEKLLNPSAKLCSAEISDKAAYLLSLLESDSIQAVIEDIIDMTAMEMTRDGPVLDFRWSKVFEEHPIYTSMEALSHPIKNQYNWSGTLLQLIQTVPLDYWCQHYNVTPEQLVSAIYNGLNGAIFSEAWWTRLLHETREDFLRALLKNKVTGFWFKPWDYSPQRIEQLPFELFQIVVDEWLNHA